MLVPPRFRDDILTSTRYETRPDSAPGSTGAEAQPRTRIAFADALRATAILSVIACHFGLRTHVRIFGHGLGLTWLGLWAVDCFFVLTGYLLSKPYLSAIADGSRFPSTKSFYARRFLRIYPLYFVAVVASVAAAVASGVVPDAGDVLSHLTLTHGLFPDYISGLNAPLWTMSVDAQFYLLFPLCAFVALKLLMPLEPGARDLTIWLGLAAVAAFGILERAVALHLSQGAIGNDDARFVLSRNVFGMSTDFAIGIGLAFLEMRNPIPSHKRGTYVTMIAVSFLLIVSLIPLAAASRISSTQLVADSVSDAIGGLSAGMLLYAINHGAFEGLTRIVRSKWVGWIALLSYGMYLFHDLFIAHFGLLFDKRLVAPINASLFAIVIMTFIVLTAFAGHVFVERRFLLLRDRQRP